MSHVVAALSTSFGVLLCLVLYFLLRSDHSLEVQQNCLIPDRQHHCLDPMQLGESSDQQKPSLRSTTAELLSTEFMFLEMQLKRNAI